MECKYCNYYWEDDNQPYAMCHWTSRCPGDIPPCEEEDYDPYNDPNV